MGWNVLMVAGTEWNAHTASPALTRGWTDRDNRTKQRKGEDSIKSGNVPVVRRPAPQGKTLPPPVCLVDRSRGNFLLVVAFLSWVGLQVCLFVSVFEQQLGGGRWFLLHTDSSVASSRGLMYSNPSNSDWSILLMTSLRREGWKEQLEDLFYHRATESKPGLLLASLRWASPHLFPGLESKGSKMMFFGGVEECPCWIADHCLEHFQALYPLSYGSVFIFLAISAGISRTYLLIQIPLNLL